MRVGIFYVKEKYKINNRYNNWIIEKDHLENVFSDVSCEVTSSYTRCIASDYRCSVNQEGLSYCYDYSSNLHCHVYGDGSAYCGE